jgi:hypothetical protein
MLNFALLDAQNVKSTVYYRMKSCGYAPNEIRSNTSVVNSYLQVLRSTAQRKEKLMHNYDYTSKCSNVL